jgi:hypothetical protein
MKKIMFMMMPLFLTALIFGAGCSQSSSDDDDDGENPGYATEANDYVYQSEIDSNGLLAYWLADTKWTKATNRVIQFLPAPAGSTVKLNGKLRAGSTVREPLVPAGKTLWLTGPGVTLAPEEIVVVEGDLVVQANTTLEAGGSTDDDYILLRGAGRLRVDPNSTLNYGPTSSLTSILKGEASALKVGGIEFRPGGKLNLKEAQTSNRIIIVASTSNSLDRKEISLQDIYNNSKDGDVYIYQGGLTNDQVINFPVVSGRGYLVVDGDGSLVSEFNSSSIEINEGLHYRNLKSTAENRPVIVRGILEPERLFYAQTLTIAPGAQYSNSFPTKLNESLTVNGIGYFSSLEFLRTTTPVLAVGRAGSLAVNESTTFDYSPTIDGTLVLVNGGKVQNSAVLNIGGSLYLGEIEEDNLVLTDGTFDSKAGSVSISAPTGGADGLITLWKDSTLTVNNSLNLTDGLALVAGSVVTTDAQIGDVSALKLDDIRLNGRFTVTGGAGTNSAQITTTGKVTFENKFGSLGGVLGVQSGDATIDFLHNKDNKGDVDTNFVFTGDLLSTNGKLNTLSLVNGQSIVFGENALADAGVGLTGGFYRVQTEGGGSQLALGYLPGGGYRNFLGIGIGLEESSNSTDTSLILGGDSTVRFFSDGDTQRAYLLTGAPLAVRNNTGTETGFLAVKGTQGTQRIAIDNVFIIGQASNVKDVPKGNPDPLFPVTAAGTASGTLSAYSADGGSLTVDHKHVWEYSNGNWRMTQ